MNSGVHALQHAGRHVPAEDHAIGVALGEQVERRAGLLEAGPEHRAGGEQRDHRNDALALVQLEAGEEHQVGEVAGGQRDQRPVGDDRDAHRVERQRAGQRQRGDHHDDDHEADHRPPSRGLAERHDAGSAEVMLGDLELHQAEQHADRRQREARAPAERRGGDRHEDRAEERAEVDAHVEDREAGIAARAAFGIELRDDGADVRLEQADAEHDHQQADEEQLRVAGGERAIAEHDQHAAPEHGALLADQPVGDPAAEQREQVGARRCTGRKWRWRCCRRCPGRHRRRLRP